MMGPVGSKRENDFFCEGESLTSKRLKTFDSSYTDEMDTTERKWTENTNKKQTAKYEALYALYFNKLDKILTLLETPSADLLQHFFSKAYKEYHFQAASQIFLYASTHSSEFFFYETVKDILQCEQKKPSWSQYTLVIQCPDEITFQVNFDVMFHRSTVSVFSNAHIFQIEYEASNKRFPEIETKKRHIGEVIKWCYHQDIVLTHENVHPIMIIAKHFKMEALQLKAENYMKNAIDLCTPDNCVTHFRNASRHGPTWFREQAAKYVIFSKKISKCIKSSHNEFIRQAIQIRDREGLNKCLDLSKDQEYDRSSFEHAYNEIDLSDCCLVLSSTTQRNFHVNKRILSSQNSFFSDLFKKVDAHTIYLEKHMDFSPLTAESVIKYYYGFDLDYTIVNHYEFQRMINLKPVKSSVSQNMHDTEMADVVE